MKNLILASLLCSSFQVFSQDTIHYLKSEPIVVKLEEINPGKIKYKMWDYQNGPSYWAARRDIARITTADGKTLWINENQWEKHRDGIIREQRGVSVVRRPYKKNIISVAPIGVMVYGVGGGFGYERVNKTGNIGLRVFAIGTVDYPGFFITPGVRIYPFGQRIGSFFVSPSLLAGYGYRDVYYDSLNVYGKKENYTKQEQQAQLGFIVEAGVMLHLTKRMVLNVQMGGGLDYLSMARNDGDYGLAKFELSFGYRF